jgi:hypothetical protein
VTGDRCYDFWNIFAEKNWRFWLKNTAEFYEKCIIILVFKKNRQFFRRKLVKIAENCDHNIDPGLGVFLPIGRLFSSAVFYNVCMYWSGPKLKCMILFCTIICISILTKSRWAKFLVFFTNTSCHLEAEWILSSRKQQH